MLQSHPAIPYVDLEPWKLFQDALNDRVNALDKRSDHLIVGLLDIADPAALGADLTALREQFLADPYFRNVPSMQADREKTAIEFHAKDDIPEVRRDVFKTLLKHEVRFFAVVRDKRRIVQLVQDHNVKQPQYRYHPNQLYDRCVSRLFKDRLHKDDAYRIVFAKRGASDRTAALRKSLEAAGKKFRESWGIEATAPIEVVPNVPSKDAGLQAADYFLWALQRLYERNEARYWDFVRPKVSLVHDVDDGRNHEYGEYYVQRNPLTLEAIAKRMPGI